MKTPKEWQYKGWTIEKCSYGDFWIAAPGGRKALTKAKTLSETKLIVNGRIAKAISTEKVLKANGIQTIGDVDKAKRGSESRHDVLVRLLGSKMANEILHILSVKSCNKAV